MRQIMIVVVGMPGAGKSIARMYAEKNQIPYFATGDRVREEVRQRGLVPNPEIMARVSDELRGKDGLGVTRLVLQAARQSGASLVFLEGMRSWPEIELVRQEGCAVVIAIVAPRKLRLDRIRSRGRSDDAPERFAHRDQREIDYGAAIPIALADAYLLNTGTLEEADETLDAMVTKIRNSI
jgi:dephospho-CoA kinase